MIRAKIIGLQRGKVKLSPYTSVWKKEYKREEKALYSLIGSYVEDIQHVGSTSIPGVESKPIIDIAIGVKFLKTGERCIKPLEKLGYEYKWDAGIRGRHFFVKGGETNRTHYLHIEKLHGRLWKNHILFRDYLCRHKKVIKEYNEIKRKLEKQYKNDRDTYAVKKSVFIQKILEKAELE